MIEINYVERRQDNAYHKAVQVQPFHVITRMNAHLSALPVYKFPTEGLSLGEEHSHTCAFILCLTHFSRNSYTAHLHSQVVMGGSYRQVHCLV